jgi:hypothetical protein
MTDQPAGKTSSIRIAAVNELLRAAVDVPPRWLRLVVAVAILSCFELSSGPDGTTLTFRVTTVTVALIALAWAPALIHVIGLAGGAVKTPLGEASSGGLLDLLRSLDVDTQREALPAVIAALGSPSSGSAAAAVQEELESELAKLPIDAASAPQRLNDLARQYEAIRESLKASSERTFKMTQVFTEARGVAASARLEPMYLSELWTRQRIGDRIVVLAAIQANPQRAHLEIVLDSIQAAASPFEQYQALRTIEMMLPMLSDADRRRAREVIEGRRDPKADGVRFDDRTSDRGQVAERILRVIGSPDRG